MRNGAIPEGTRVGLIKVLKLQESKLDLPRRRSIMYDCTCLGCGDNLSLSEYTLKRGSITSCNRAECRMKALDLINGKGSTDLSLPKSME
mgnify:FL=1|jgi:hypothetical protein